MPKYFPTSLHVFPFKLGQNFVAFTLVFRENWSRKMRPKFIYKRHPCRTPVWTLKLSEMSPFWHVAFKIVAKEVLWSVRGSYQTRWCPPLPNVTRNSGWWPYTVTPSIDRTLHHFLTVTDLDLITEFDFLPNYARFSIEYFQRARHANRGRLLLRTPGPVPLWDLHVF